MTSFSAISIRKSQLGIGLPAAIFVITLLVVIAFAISQLVSQNAASFEEEINLTRAFYAAESGAGFAMNRLYPPEEYPGYTSDATCAATTTFSLVSDGLNSCSVTVTCNEILEGSKYYATIKSTGTCNDVERTIQVRTSY